MSMRAQIFVSRSFVPCGVEDSKSRLDDFFVQELRIDSECVPIDELVTEPTATESMVDLVKSLLWVLLDPVRTAFVQRPLPDSSVNDARAELDDIHELDS